MLNLKYKKFIYIYSFMHPLSYWVKEFAYDLII